MRPFDTQASEESEGHPDFDVLERYWFGEVTSEEKQMLEKWLLDNPQWRTRYSHLLSELSQGRPSDFAQHDIDRLIAGVKTAVNPLSQHRRHAWRLPKLGGFAGLTAAVIAIIAIFGITMLERKSLHDEPRQEYVTGIGQRMTFMLLDGSKVTLAPNTTVQIESSFGISNRNVQISGEAYFDVVSHSSLPFVVKVEKWETRVLGTQFVVKKYSDDPALSIAVRSGRVAIGGTKEKGTILDAGMVASVNGTTTIASDSLNMSSYTDWINGHLVFNNASLQETLQTLHRWYGADFSIGDSTLLSARITGTIPYGSLDEMVQLLEILLEVPLSVTRHNNGSLLIAIKP